MVMQYIYVTPHIKQSVFAVVSHLSTSSPHAKIDKQFYNLIRQWL